jgi:pyruvate/2-oxoglutarate dehydrogenase complex dihydrolipoamide dehydrogenase (E3) component
MIATSRTTICIIGAGPYGITLAVHLKYFGVDFRIFGSPMRRWLTQMPNRMLLKSEGCASSLYDPTGNHTLGRYCCNEGLPYSEYGAPISRGIFSKYAIFFQQKLVPNVEDLVVTMVKQSSDGFEVSLRNGEKTKAGKVVVATGMDHMAYIPDQLTSLPAELRSHSADHHDLRVFKGKDVVVIGGGQSGLETAAILREEGASVHLLVRQPSLQWNPTPSMIHRSILDRLRNPRTRLGDGRDLWLYDNLPGLFHYLPQRIRHAKIATALGPAGGWWLKDRVVDRFPILLGHYICRAEHRCGNVLLQIIDRDGQRHEINTNHVLAATGYRFNSHNLPFLSEEIKARLRYEQQLPQLSANFESSIAGLYFVGLGSAHSFGPAMRFLVGSNYTARRISSHAAQGQRLPKRSLAQHKRCPEF